jgi:hypothetical protein
MNRILCAAIVLLCCTIVWTLPQPSTVNCADHEVSPLGKPLSLKIIFVALLLVLEKRRVRRRERGRRDFSLIADGKVFIDCRFGRLTRGG